MDITIEYLERKFDEFNNQIFKGELPKIPLKVTDVKGFIGLCSYKRKFGDDNNTLVPYDFSISINSRLDLPENEIEDTIIHEMIHYYVGYKQLEDASSHGPVFKTMMNLINEKFGRHITISHKCDAEEAEQSSRDHRRDKVNRFPVFCSAQNADQFRRKNHQTPGQEAKDIRNIVPRFLNIRDLFPVQFFV